MSALTDLFTAMATKIRSKTGTQTTYTPSEMVSDGIDDVYDAGVASVPTPTDITPSNASPVSLTANTAVNPTASGYAIESYSVKTPTANVIYPVDSGKIYKMGDGGYLIKSYSMITPSDSSPVQFLSGEFCRMTDNGYAISSYSSKTPSDTSPASVSSGAIIKASSAGYLVKNTPVDLGVPDLVSQVDMAASASRSITVTSKPKVVVLIQSQRGSDGAQFLQIYDSVKDKYTTATYTAGGGYAHSDGTGLPGRITTVSTTTVTVKNASTGYAVRSSVLIYY